MGGVCGGVLPRGRFNLDFPHYFLVLFSFLGTSFQPLGPLSVGASPLVMGSLPTALGKSVWGKALPSVWGLRACALPLLSGFSPTPTLLKLEHCWFLFVCLFFAILRNTPLYPPLCHQVR